MFLLFCRSSCSVTRVLPRVVCWLCRLLLSPVSSSSYSVHTSGTISSHRWGVNLGKKFKRSIATGGVLALQAALVTGQFIIILRSHVWYHLLSQVGGQYIFVKTEHCHGWSAVSVGCSRYWSLVSSSSSYSAHMSGTISSHRWGHYNVRDADSNSGITGALPVSHPAEVKM